MGAGTLGGQWVDGRTGGRGRAGTRTGDGRTGQRTGRRVGGLADRWTGERGRTSGRRISKGKTPDLMRQLTWPWEIQRGRPQVIVKLPHLPPPSRFR